VVATNSPISDRFALHTKMAPYRTYAMAFETKAGALPDTLYWDTLDPYHYVRLQPGGQQHDYVVVGGADHKSGEADDDALRFDALKDWARNLIPALGSETHRWSKFAAYRDQSGTLFVRSAACTHLGCHLHWNSFETCWDCPCHGSQFAVDGTALNAPAVGSLDRVEDDH
jgi:glycine/D-amino acid oxidase-like deaminating enzyme